MSTGTQQREILRGTLATYGRALTVTRTVPGSYDEDTGIVVPDTPTPYAGRGRVGSYKDSAIDGTLILRGDRKVTWQPSDASFIPTKTDTIAFDGATYAIIDIVTRELEGDWIAYTLQVRR